MLIVSFTNEVTFDETSVKTKVLIETSFSKEIRILIKKGRHMKRHQAPYPILIHILEGEIELGVESNSYTMTRGDITALVANVPHDLAAKEDAIIRLSLSKQDQVERLHNL